jgi:N-succinyldiaminopimelate aminotransferase
VRPALSSRLAGFGTTIFTEMTRLANERGAINLSQGFPDFDGPEFVKEAAIAAIRAGHGQYARMTGLPEVHRALAAKYRRDWGLDFAPDAEIVVTSGATEAIFAAIQGICEAGDEVVLFEPYYDSYKASVCMAGAVPRVVTLRAPEWAFDPAELAAAFSPRTRAVLVNTPHNPTGKVFSEDELGAIADLCRERGVLCITDEVYEHLVYERPHVPLASRPGMRDRTVTISSTGKTFSLTGWKIGYTCAAPPLTDALRMVHQFVTFTIASPFQHAMAAALTTGDAFFEGLVADYRSRRDRLCAGLRDAGFEVRAPEGTYFALADIRPLGYEDAETFCRELPARVGVAAIPASAFYAHPAAGRHLVRFAFCKKDETLEEGLRRLRTLRR